MHLRLYLLLRVPASYAILGEKIVNSYVVSNYVLSLIDIRMSTP